MQDESPRISNLGLEDLNLEDYSGADAVPVETTTPLTARKPPVEPLPAPRFALEHWFPQQSQLHHTAQQPLPGGVPSSSNAPARHPPLCVVRR